MKAKDFWYQYCYNNPIENIFPKGKFKKIPKSKVKNK